MIPSPPLLPFAHLPYLPYAHSSNSNQTVAAVATSANLDKSSPDAQNVSGQWNVSGICNMCTGM